MFCTSVGVILMATPFLLMMVGLYIPMFETSSVKISPDPFSQAALGHFDDTELVRLNRLALGVTLMVCVSPQALVTAIR